MTDRQYRKQKKRIQRYIDRWAAPLGMKWWEITYVWHDEPYRDASDGRTPCARTLVDWDYRRATIHFYLPDCKGESDKQTEDMVIHEFMHVLLNEMRQWQDANDALAHEERTAVSLVQVVRWVTEASRRGDLGEALAGADEPTLGVDIPTGDGVAAPLLVRYRHVSASSTIHAGSQ